MQSYIKTRHPTKRKFSHFNIVKGGYSVVPCNGLRTQASLHGMAAYTSWLYHILNEIQFPRR